eukprot:1147798-Pelagomonas_calceolata.AAC.3
MDLLVEFTIWIDARLPHGTGSSTGQVRQAVNGLLAASLIDFLDRIDCLDWGEASAWDRCRWDI